jgi:hydroxymethylbilane synthase
VNTNRLVIGTRGSALARWQAEHIAAALRAANPGLEVVLSIIVTEGDRFQAGPVVEVGGKAVWVKEIEVALATRTVDLAVHSLKDVPVELAPGLGLVAIPPRADPRDALITRTGQGLAALPAGARVGTSSLRRVCQLLALRPDLRVEVLRGNVDTRLRKVEEGVVDAAVLACAGLDRLGHAGRIAERIAIDAMVPAIGQGALALEARADDAVTAGRVASLNDPAGALTVAAERALLAGLGGSCRTPIGGHASLAGARLTLLGLVGRPDGKEILRDQVEGPADHATALALGAALALKLRARGADKILAECG